MRVTESQMETFFFNSFFMFLSEDQGLSSMFRIKKNINLFCQYAEASILGK